MDSEQLWHPPLTLNLVTLNERNYPQPDRRLYWHSHPFYELGLVLEGRCIWGLGSRKVMVCAGEAILVRPGQRHSETVPPEGRATLAWLGFGPSRQPSPAWSGRPIGLGEYAAEVAATFEVIMREHPRGDELTQARVHLALQTILLLVCRQATLQGEPEPASDLNPRQTHCVESAAHYFRQNLADCLSIAQVAAYHSLCPAHFSSLFTRHHGIGPRAYLLRVRLEQAATLLEREPTLGLKEIARRCGFSDAAHLCKAFRKGYAMTPLRYRTRHGGGAPTG